MVVIHCFILNLVYLQGVRDGMSTSISVDVDGYSCFLNLCILLCFLIFTLHLFTVSKE